MFLRVPGRREADVGHHAAVLRGPAVDTEKLRHGDLELADARRVRGRIIVEIQEALDRTLAEGGFTDDQAAAVVLDGGREDLGRRRAVAIDQHRQRAFPGHARIQVLFHADPAGGIAHLHDGAAIDEQAGQGRGLQQRTAAIVAQVDHQSLDALLLQFADQAAHVARARTVIGQVERAAVEIQVKHRQVDDADLHRSRRSPGAPR